MEEYRYLATSVTGFVQQLVTGYVCRGYYFFVQGMVPEGKDPTKIDAKLMDRYDVAKTRKERYRRKRRGLANVHYLRFERHWILLCSHGEHQFWELERDNVRDSRKVPIHFLGYSICLSPGLYKPYSLREKPDVAERDTKLRVRVQIGRKAYSELKAEFHELANRLSREAWAGMFWNLPFEPYAPIRSQKLELLRQVNKRRKLSRLPKIEPTVIRYKRQIVKPFGELAV